MPPVKKMAPLFLIAVAVSACSEGGYHAPSVLREFQGEAIHLASEAPARPVRSMSSAEIGRFVPKDTIGANVTTGGVVGKRRRVAVAAPAVPEIRVPEYANIVVIDSPLMTGE